MRVCYVCRTIWCIFIFSLFSYIIFSLNNNPFWYAFAVFCCMGDCKAYRTPEQLAADKDTD